jgi:hypothetical protein
MPARADAGVKAESGWGLVAFLAIIRLRPGLMAALVQKPHFLSATLAEGVPECPLRLVFSCVIVALNS